MSAKVKNMTNFLMTCHPQVPAITRLLVYNGSMVVAAVGDLWLHCTELVSKLFCDGLHSGVCDLF